MLLKQSQNGLLAGLVALVSTNQTQTNQTQPNPNPNPTKPTMGLIRLLDRQSGGVFGILGVFGIFTAIALFVSR
jgi:predicted lipid-binding transport protein (Tim44 family)